MANPYPAQVSLFEVVGRLGRGFADDGDADQEPTLLPLAGAKVTFTPSLVPPVFRVATATPPIRIYQESVQAITDEQGYLKIEDDAQRGVFLPWGFDPDINPSGWTWNVLVEPGGNFPSDRFSIDGGPPGTVIDLFFVQHVPENPGTEIPLWIAVRDQVLGAAAQLRADIAAGDYKGPKGDKGDTGSQGVKGDPSDRTTQVALANVSGTLNLAPYLTSTTVVATLSGAVTAITLPTPVSPDSYTITLILKQPAAGAAAVTLPTTALYPDRLRPPVGISPNERTRLQLLWADGVWEIMLGSRNAGVPA